MQFNVLPGLINMLGAKFYCAYTASRATFAQQSRIGRGEPGALIEYQQKPLEGWFLEGPPLTPQTLPA
jgi:hypothetical protein